VSRCAETFAWCSETTALTFDPEERRREKQASRDEDARRLAAGEVTPAQLARENSPFSGLVGVPDYSRVGLPRYRRP
jgi:hypothetical protein